MGNNAPNASFVARHKPSFLVLASQVSAACIHGIVEILETEERPVHPFRVLQVRLFITGISCMLYLWCIDFPDFLLGPKDVRPLLFVRAVGGVCGAIGFYCMMLARVPKVISPETEHHLADHVLVSIIYLTIAQATALSFLRPDGLDVDVEVSRLWQFQCHRQSRCVDGTRSRCSGRATNRTPFSIPQNLR